MRGIRLLRSNPRLFLRRLRLLAASPRATWHALQANQQRYVAVQDGYDRWRQTPPPPGAQHGPLLSVLMPVFNPPEAAFQSAVDSVLSQTYQYWELCIADDASTEPIVHRKIEEFCARDARIKVVYRPVSGHISAASNSALNISSGEFVVLLDHDDVLAPHALARVAETANLDDVDLIYSDEDKLDASGRHIEPFFKPAWSPSLLASCNYITHLAALRRSLVCDLGGFRDHVVGSQDHDLFLRVSERARRIAHVPDILYSWRQSPGSTARASVAKPYAVSSAHRALTEALERRGIEGRLQETHLNGLFQVRRHRRPARLSVVLGGDSPAWRDLQASGADIVDVALAPNSESSPPGLAHVPLRDLAGEYVLWLDAGVQPASPDWLGGLLETMEDPDVAIAGGVTVHQDGYMLQAGIIVDSGRLSYAYAGLPLLPSGNFYLNLKDLPHEVSAVHPGISLTRAEVWSLDPERPPGLWMAETCLRAIEQGGRVVLAPLARMQTAAPLPALPSLPTTSRWTGYRDPYWNPNMSPTLDGLPFRDGRCGVRVLRAN